MAQAVRGVFPFRFDNNAYMALPFETPDSSDATDAPAMQSAAPDPGSLAAVTRRVEDLLKQASFPLDTVDAESARAMKDSALTHIQDYVQPRLASQQAPMLAVIGGSTGAGKSTLINSLLGERVTLPGALRPTTRNPVLVHNPADEQWFSDQRVLPNLKREHTHSGATERASFDEGADTTALLPATTRKELRLVASDSVPRGLALIDSPDVDSMVDSNREMAHQLLGAADLWIFLTTAARYADAVPWEALKSAAARQTEVAIVVDRVDPSALEVVSDLRSMLDTHDLANAPLFVIEEQPLQDGFLPKAATAHLGGWLAWLMLTPGARDQVVEATRTGAIEALGRTVEQLAVYTETQIRARDSLMNAVTQAYARAEKNIAVATSDGTMLRGEVLNRWQDYVGTGEFMRGIEEKISAARDKIAAYFRGKSTAPKVQRAVGDSLFAVVKDQCDLAAETAFSEWHDNVAGKSLTLRPALSTSSPELQERLAYEIRQWQGAVLELVSEQGAGKRSKARALALGTNGIGVALMIAALATTGGLTGVEVGITGGTALVAQRLLESVFGEDAVRRLAVEAQRELSTRIASVLEHEQKRYAEQLESLELHESLAQQLRAAARELHAGVNVSVPRHAGRSHPSVSESSESHQASRAGAPQENTEGLRRTEQYDGIHTQLDRMGAPTLESGESSEKWFGGGIDAEGALELSKDFYEGATLYGTAGAGLGTGPGADDGGARHDGAERTQAPKKWWQRFRKSTDTGEAR